MIVPKPLILVLPLVSILGRSITVYSQRVELKTLLHRLPEIINVYYAYILNGDVSVGNDLESDPGRYREGG